MVNIVKIIKNTVLPIVFLFLLSWGCAPVSRQGEMSASQIDALKTKVGHVGIVAAQFPPQVYVKVPARNVSEGAIEGAKIPVQIAVGLLQGASNCGSGEFCLLVLATGVALTPVGAIVGGAESAVSAESPAEVSLRESRINESVIYMQMNEHMRDRFSSRLAGLQTFSSSTLPAGGPEKEGQKPDYHLLKSDGIDTVCELSVQRLALNGIGVVRPDLSVTLRVQVRLVSTMDNQELIATRFACLSKDHSFEDWALNDAQRFREEIARCYDVISENAVTELFTKDILLRPHKPRRHKSKQTVNVSSEGNVNGNSR